MTVKSFPANRKLIRDINQNSLLNLIKTEGPVSRTRLAELSGLSLATISGVTGRLLERNLILEAGAAQSTGGRKAGLLEIQPEGGYALGLKITEHEVVAVILNLNAEIVYSERIKVELRGEGRHSIQLLAREVEQLSRRARLPAEKIIGLGCGLPGIINGVQGICIDSPILGWHQVDVAGLLGNLLNLPVYLDNDVNSLAIYEKFFGQGQNYQNFLTVTIGRGLGLGLVINGDVYRGALGGAGELGHTTVAVGGRQCECGKRGCLEAYVSDHGFVETYLAKAGTATLIDLPEAAGFEVVLQQAQAGEKAAIATFEEAGQLLGVSLANLVNILNPEMIILSGSGAVAGKLLFNPLQKVFKEHCFGQLGEQLRLLVEPTGDESWARGAGSLVLRKFFLSPIEAHSEKFESVGIS